MSKEEVKQLEQLLQKACDNKADMVSVMTKMPERRRCVMVECARSVYDGMCVHFDLTMQG